MHPSRNFIGMAVTFRRGLRSNAVRAEQPIKKSMGMDDAFDRGLRSRDVSDVQEFKKPRGISVTCSMGVRSMDCRLVHISKKYLGNFGTCVKCDKSNFFRPRQQDKNRSGNSVMSTNEDPKYKFSIPGQHERNSSGSFSSCVKALRSRVFTFGQL